jgi:hypothetical protein
MTRICLLFLLSIVFSCNNSSSSSAGKDDSTVNDISGIDLERNEIKTAPVAVYDKPLNDLNNWHFTVKLSETKQRFNYLLHMQYQEVTGSDTIRFPNFGFEPTPQIKKGDSDLECIIGFLDKEKNFREYIKVFVENDQLRMKTLKQYVVYEK